MPAAQIFCAGIEQALNRYIQLDPDSAGRLAVLSGKQMKVTLKECPWPLLFCFSDRIDVLAIGSDDNTQADCAIALSLGDVRLLQDASQISQLIKQSKLDLQGDIHVAQAFANVIKHADIDWEEEVSQYTGDVLAHQVFASAKRMMQQASKQAGTFSERLKDALIEEKHLAPHPDAIEAFCQQVNELRGDTERLAARLSLLEKSKQA